MNMGSTVWLNLNFSHSYVPRQLSNPANVNVIHDDTIAKIMQIKYRTVPIV